MEEYKFYSYSASKIPTFTVQVRNGEIVEVELNDTERAEKETITKEREFNSEEVEKIGGYFKEMLQYNPYQFRNMLSSLSNEQQLYEYGSNILSAKRALIERNISATSISIRKRQLEEELKRYMPCPLKPVTT